MANIDDVINWANWLLDSQAARISLQHRMKRLYMLEWDERLSDKPGYIKETRDTTPHDAVNAVTDVLSNNAPSISIKVPRVLITDKAEVEELAASYGETTSQTGELLELVARAALRHNDARRISPLQRDLILSFFLYDMATAKIADLRRSSQWTGKKLTADNQFPFVVQSVEPMHVCYDTDALGLSVVMHRYNRPLREVHAIYGSKVAGLGDFPTDLNGYVTFVEWWERDHMAKWIERVDRVRQEPGGTVVNYKTLEDYDENPLGFIPFVMKTARGAQMFETPEAQIMPMLYGGHKSNIFYRANLFLSIVSTLAFAMANPQFTYSSASGTKTFELGFDGPNVYPIQNGEKLEPLVVGLNRDLYEVLQLFLQKSQNTTVSPVIMGQVPPGVTAAAALNLVAQGGKIGIHPIQYSAGQLYQGIIQTIFDYVRLGNENVRFLMNGQMQEVAPENIPDWMDIDVTFRSDLPSDKAMLINSAIQAMQAGLFSKETAWELVGVEDKLEEQERLDRQNQMRVPEDDPNFQPPGPQGMPGQLNPNQGPPQIAANPQAANPVLDMMNAAQNATENPMERMG